MNPLTVAIRANGGDVIGLGHIRRCLSLAQALARQGAIVLFITNANKTALDLVRENGFDATAVDPEADFEQTCEAIGGSGASVLVVDSYDLDADYLIRIREHVSLLVAVDDVADRPLPVDMVSNGTVYADSLRYEVLPETQLLLGAAYVILREEFAREVVRRINHPVRRILITIGGSDPKGLTQRLVEWLRQENRLMDLDVVVGPFFKDPTPIAEAAMREPEHVRVYHDPSDMRSIMLEADLAIMGGGQTAYELAATGTPAVAIATAEHQLQNLNALAQAGTLVHAGSLDDPQLKAKLLAQLRKLLDEPERLHQMSRRGRELVDGLGARRLAEAIIKEHALRAATLPRAQPGRA